MVLFLSNCNFDHFNVDNKVYKMKLVLLDLCSRFLFDTVHSNRDLSVLISRSFAYVNGTNRIVDGIVFKILVLIFGPYIILTGVFMIACSVF